MKHLWIALLATGCLASRTDELVCDVNTDCADGRVCDAGFCVVAPEEDEPDPVTEPPVLPPDPVDECETWTSAHFDACQLPAGTSLDLTEPGIYIYNTDSAQLRAPGQTTTTIPANTSVESGRVLVAEHLSLGADSVLRVIGKAPLIIASETTIEIDGAIDATSTAIERGAGANADHCAMHPARAGTNNVHGGGGGGGAGFGGTGGRGGDGDQDGNAAGGAAGTQFVLPLLAGGCPGGRGGTGDQPGGLGGGGGGAVQLSTRLAVTIRGAIHAGGAGGRGATSNGNDADGGGGGGGSGGMIGIETPSLAIEAGAVLAANGGGGGQGADVMAGGVGDNGLIAETRAAGGTGGDGDVGGFGSGDLDLAGAPGDEAGLEGAGGGGGGAGFVAILSASRSIDGTLSPAAVLLP